MSAKKKISLLAFAVLCAVGAIAVSYTSVNTVHIFNSLIDNTTIGGTNPAPATVTTLSATSSLTTPAATIGTLTSTGIGTSGLTVTSSLLTSYVGANVQQLGTDGSGIVRARTVYKDLTMVIDGGGSTITTGWKGVLEVPFACTIQGWTLLTRDTGSLTVDVYQSNYGAWPTVVSITNGHFPALTSYKAQDFGVGGEGWTTSLGTNTLIGFSVGAASGVQQATIAVRVSIP